MTSGDFTLGYFVVTSGDFGVTWSHLVSHGGHFGSHLGSVLVHFWSVCVVYGSRLFATESLLNHFWVTSGSRLVHFWITPSDVVLLCVTLCYIMDLISDVALLIMYTKHCML